ncbi:hypothetical protein J3R83DRAFT_8588 [Lanmaoa asiatica]|nr:hypothetical protein J3R83DRAFT_8588 [Lanmaoa asiatica]
MDAAVTKLSQDIEHRVGTLEDYFKHSNNHTLSSHPPKSRKVEAPGLIPVVHCELNSLPDVSSLATQSVSVPVPLVPPTPDVNSTSAESRMALLIQDTPGNQGCTSCKTRSQHLFLTATGINLESLTIKGDHKFFLFMEMCAEFHWISYEMTSRKWVEATDKYNCQLVQKLGGAAIRKNPLALLRKLGKMEGRLIERVLKDNFRSKRNTKAFWRHHCFIINLVKANATTSKKPHKVPTCSCCKTIMYPGPEKLATNHK